MKYEDTYISVSGRVPWHTVDAAADPRSAGPPFQRESGAPGYEVMSENGRPNVRHIRDACFRGLTRYESSHYHDPTKDHTSDVGKLVVCTRRSGASGDDDPEFIPMTEVLFGSGASITATANKLTLSGTDGAQEVKIANVADPSADNDAATKNYVDSRVRVSPAVVMIAGSNITLTPAASTGDITIAVSDSPAFNGAILAKGDLEVRGTTVVRDLTASASVMADTFIAVSDARLKTDIESMCGRDALDKVIKLRPCTYEMIGSPGVRRAGLIAQEVEVTIPMCVQRTARRIGGVDQALGVNYTDVVAFLVASVRALSEELGALSAEVAELHKGMR